MVRQSGGAAVVAALTDHGVDTVFGIPGTHNLEIYRYLGAAGVRHVAPRHEQGAGYAADGYARVTGRPGVVVTTTGPGLTNVSTAAATAYADSIPVLIVSPGVPRGLDRADVGWLHEMKDQSGHFDRLLDRSVRVGSADEAYQAIAETFARWRVERPRPVHVEVPVDVLDGEWSGTRPSHEVPALPPFASATAVRSARDALGRARRPIALFGGGTQHAYAEARRLVEAYDLPVVTTVNGKGVVPEDHPLSLGASLRLPAACDALEDADVLLVVGSELGDSDLWGRELRPRGTVIRADIDERQLHKNVPADIALHGDAGDTLDLLVDLPDEPGRERDGARRAAAVRAGVAEQERDGEKWRGVNEILAAELPADAVVAGDSAQVSYYGTVHFWPARRPGQFLYPTGYATLGYGLPAAIGAKVAEPERTTAVLTGDGGFLFTANELATAAELRLAIPVIVMNNRGYAEIREEMDQRGIPRTAVDFDVVDFPALGRAYGGAGVRLSGLDELPAALQKALSTSAPTVIEVPVP